MITMLPIVTPNSLILLVVIKIKSRRRLIPALLKIRPILSWLVVLIKWSQLFMLPVYWVTFCLNKRLRAWRTLVILTFQGLFALIHHWVKYLRTRTMILRWVSRLGVIKPILVITPLKRLIRRRKPLRAIVINWRTWRRGTLTRSFTRSVRCKTRLFL